MSGSNNLLLVSDGFFAEIVDEAISQRKVKTIPLVKNYITELLFYFMKSENLYDEESESGKKRHSTLAELYLKAMNLNGEAKLETLKKLGNISLYIGGFFGDSLQRKIVDVDYYVDMGESAFGHLSESVPEDTFKRLYFELSTKFLQFVDVLTFVSQKTIVHNDENLLRLYENYIRTGSELARDHLLEKGIHLPEKKKKIYSQ